MYSAVMLVRGELAFLTEVSNVSLGGASVAKPRSWNGQSGEEYLLYFVFDQDTILSIKGKVAHAQPAHVGFEFLPSEATRASELLEESRHWDKFSG
jgi:hypothetical protein